MASSKFKGIYTSPRDTPQEYTGLEQKLSLKRKASIYRLGTSYFQREQPFAKGGFGEVSRLRDLEAKQKDFVVKKDIDSEQISEAIRSLEEKFQRTKDEKYKDAIVNAKKNLQIKLKKSLPAWQKETYLFNVLYGNAEIHNFRMIMPILGDRTIEDELKKNKSDLEILDMLIRIIHAYQLAHSLGIVFLDIKANNILTDDQGNIWPCDFGLAHELNEFCHFPFLNEQRCGQFAPELKKGVVINPALDVYALGDFIERSILPALRHSTTTLIQELKAIYPHMREKKDLSKRMTLDTVFKNLIEIRGRVFQSAPDLTLTLNPFFAEKAGLLKDFKDNPIDKVITSIIEEKSEKMTRMASTFVRYFIPLKKWDEIQQLAFGLKDVQPELLLNPIFAVALQRAAEEKPIPENFYKAWIDLLPQLITLKDWTMIKNIALITPTPLEKTFSTVMTAAAVAKQWELVNTLMRSGTDTEAFNLDILKLAIQDDQVAIIKILTKNIEEKTIPETIWDDVLQSLSIYHLQELLHHLIEQNKWHSIHQIAAIASKAGKLGSIFGIPMTRAAEAGQWGLVNFLIENKASPNGCQPKDPFYHTLHFALIAKNTITIDKLLNAGVTNFGRAKPFWEVADQKGCVQLLTHKGTLRNHFIDATAYLAEEKQWETLLGVFQCPLRPELLNQTVFENLIFAKNDPQKWQVIESFIQSNTNLQIRPGMLQISLKQKAEPKLISFLLEKIAIQTLAHPTDHSLVDALQILANSSGYRDEKINIIKHTHLNALIQYYEQNGQYQHVVRLTQLLKEIDPSYKLTDKITLEIVHKGKHERRRSRFAWLTLGAVIGFVVGLFVPVPGASALGTLLGAALAPMIGTVIGGYFEKKWLTYKTKIAAKVMSDSSLPEEEKASAERPYAAPTREIANEYVHFGPLFGKSSANEEKYSKTPTIGIKPSSSPS